MRVLHGLVLLLYTIFNISGHSQLDETHVKGRFIKILQLFEVLLHNVETFNIILHVLRFEAPEA